jgi:hypothetical protein
MAKLPGACLLVHGEAPGNFSDYALCLKPGCLEQREQLENIGKVNRFVKGYNIGLARLGGDA